MSVNQQSGQGSGSGEGQAKSQEKKIVGQPINRVDGRAKVTGAARYAVEFPLETSRKNLQACCTL